MGGQASLNPMLANLAMYRGLVALRDYTSKEPPNSSRLYNLFVVRFCLCRHNFDLLFSLTYQRPTCWYLQQTVQAYFKQFGLHQESAGLGVRSACEVNPT